VTEGFDDRGDLVEAAGLLVGEQNSQLVRLVGDSGSIAVSRGIVELLSFCVFAQWPMGSANGSFSARSLGRTHVSSIRWLTCLVPRSPREEPSVEHQACPSAATTVRGALVDREQATPSVMNESEVRSARDRRRLHRPANPVMTSSVLVFYDCCRAGIAELLEADADSSDPGDASDDGSRRWPLRSGG
jgi:hypothetical protein